MPAVRGIAMGVRTRLASRCRTRRHRGDHCRSISNSNRKAGDSSWSGFRLMLQSVWVMENMRFAPDKGCARLPRGRRSVMANWKNIGMAFLDGFAPLDNLFQRAVSPDRGTILLRLPSSGQFLIRISISRMRRRESRSGLCAFSEHLCRSASPRRSDRRRDQARGRRMVRERLRSELLAGAC